MAEWHFIVYMYHIFFHSSVNGHFHVLAVVNNADMNIGVHVSFWVIVLPEYIQGVILLDYCCCLVAKSYQTICDPMNCSMPGFLVLHYLPEFALIHVHWVSDAIQPSHLLSPASPLALKSLPGAGSFPMKWLFASGGQSIGALASVLPMNIQSWFPLGLTGLIFLLSKGQESSPAPQFKSIRSSALSLLSDPTLTSVHDYWKNHSFDYTDLCWQSDVSAF